MLIAFIVPKNYNFDLLRKEDAEFIPSPYIEVFEAHPWHEKYECSCGVGPYSEECETFGKECEEIQDGKVFLYKKNINQKCLECGAMLDTSLSPIFNENEVRDEYLEKLNLPGFTGIAIKEKSKLIGACWGYSFPLNSPKKTGGTWYAEAISLIEECGKNPQSTFYHNESFILPNYHGNNAGSLSLEKMLLIARSLGNKIVAYRTINPAMTRCYEKTFGIQKGELKPSFNDPNPEKRQSWYILNLEELK